MGSKQCAACGQAFQPRSQVPQQRFCSTRTCQNERRRLWTRGKRQSDPDYRDNQTRAQRAWCDRNPDYWREYRKTHPAYTERNRTMQRERNDRRREFLIAKRDASPPVLPVPSGMYRITRVPETGIAKRDAWTVEITLLSVL